MKKVHTVKLNRITPDKVQAWKVKYIRENGTDPQRTKAAKSTVNSIIRNSKSLFSKKALRFLKIELPSPLPFDGIEFEKAGKSRYKSEMNPELLFAAAQNELADQQPEQFKIFLLALCAGLRRNEIDTLTWDQIDLEKRVIRVETNAYTELKSADSEEEIDIDLGIAHILFAYKFGSISPFVVNSRVSPKHSTTYLHNRCYTHFRQLTRWLRSKGITARCPIHSLRKEFGSLICQQGGIFAASQQLRHSDIRITRNHYLDKKQRVTVSFQNNPLKLPSKSKSSQIDNHLAYWSKRSSTHLSLKPKAHLSTPTFFKLGRNPQV